MGESDLEIFKGQNQIILVYAKGINAKVYMCEKVDNTWKTIMETEGYIGKNGLGKEYEGDMKTPIGIYKLGIAFGIHNNVKTQLDYITLNENMYWIGDSNSKYYNQFIETTKNQTDWNNSKNEHLIDENIAYEYAIEIKYNEDGIKNKGSAIFLHCIKNGATAGCVSIPSDKMKFVLNNVKRDTCIYINYEK